MSRLFSSDSGVVFSLKSRNFAAVMKVCIAEKPSVAREIAQVLGATTKHNGYMEGNGYQVTWTFGHLCTLKEPHDYSPDFKAWDMHYLPIIPTPFGIKLLSTKGVKEQFEVIKRLMLHAEMIINCGDAGQEGELIQRWVIQKTGAKCPVKRLWISSLTEEAIREGFAQLKEQQQFNSLYMAGLSRAIGDWVLGINATRLYTIKYGQRGQLLSIGRVQTPTLALIVNRHHEIANFVSEPYWELKTRYRDTTFSATHGKFADKGKGETLLSQIIEKPFTVTDVSKKNGVEIPPRLFDLTALQVECNKKYGYSAELTLNTIQSLYEKKLTTYPRVDTTYLTDDIYPKCPTILKGLHNYDKLTAPLLAAPHLTKSKKVFDNSKVTDHHAIIPTGVTPHSLTDIERRVYDLVARRFIGVFYPDCKFAITTVLGEVEKVGFKTSGKQILSPGWRVVYEREQRDEDTADEERTLPAFGVGESGPHTPELLEKWTQPPKLYTEATLLRTMETAGKLVENEELRDAMKENGIGRPSTRAAIIETLLKRQYIRKERKNLVATETGIELISIIHEELLKSAELTGIWEKKLREIEQQKYDAHSFIDELKVMVQELVRQVASDPTNRRIAAASVAAVPSAAAKPATAKSVAPKRRKTAAAPKEKSQENPDEIVGTLCPICGKGKVLKGKQAYGCSEWRSGCKFRKPF